jgi:ComF family protein
MTSPWHNKLIDRVTGLKQQALNLLFKANCPLCDRSAQTVFCRYCQQQIQDSQINQSDRYWQGELPLFAWGKYEGAVKQSIGKLKYAGHRSIASHYGELLAASWQQAGLLSLEQNTLFAVPIPLHPEKFASRGFNQAELVARRFCQVTGIKLDLSLSRNRSTVAQFGLSRSARQENVAGAFSLNHSPIKPGTTVLLIDDIYTTGATVRSAAAVLRSHQIKVCGVAVIATGKD